MINEIFPHSLQLGVLASDGGSPAKVATATVSITVERNLNTPEFTPTSYEVSIPENQVGGKFYYSLRYSFFSLNNSIFHLNIQITVVNSMKDP